MKVQPRTLAALAAALLLALAVYVLLPGDEEQVRARLEDMAALASAPSREAPVERLRKGAELARYFADPCDLIVDDYGKRRVFGRKEITDRLIMVRDQFAPFRVSFYGIAVQVSKDGDGVKRAAVRMTMRLRGEADAPDEADGTREVEGSMARLEGDWVFTRIHVARAVDGQ